MSDVAKPRAEFRNINILNDVRDYRLPAAGWVSILHRISGALLALALPLLIWLFDKSVSSEISYGQFTSVFTAGLLGLPAWLIKLVLLVLIWAYLFHLIAGVRHIYMDVTHSVDLRFGRSSAIVTMVLAFGLTVIFGAKLFGLY